MDTMLKVVLDDVIISPPYEVMLTSIVVMFDIWTIAILEIC